MEGAEKLNYVGPGGRRRRITKVIPLSGFALQCTFDNSEMRVLKVEPLIDQMTEWTEPILDENYFNQVLWTSVEI